MSLPDELQKDQPDKKKRIQDDPFAGVVLAERYQLDELIDTGGFGRVYKATHLSLNTALAVKILHHQHLQDEATIRRFEQEAHVLSRIDNPHVVRVIDFGLEPAPYLVMEYFPGISLTKWIKANGPMPPDMTIKLFLQLCDALSAAEAVHIVHRDLKPSNILLRTDSEEFICKILDFGVAKFVDSYSSAEHLTSTGEILGSPAYMAPEQWKGQCDNRSDIYSLGCIMYETLAGKPAFSAQFGMEYMNKHVTETPLAISKVLDGVTLPAGLEDIISKCMQKAPANRYQSILSCASDLKKLSTGDKIAVSLPEKRHARLIKVLAPGLAIIFVSALAAFISQTNSILPVQKTNPSEGASAGATSPTQPIPVHVGLRYVPDKWQEKNLAQWSEAIEKDPSNPNLIYGRGQLHLYRREYGEAKHDFDRVIRIDPNFADAYVERSIANDVGSVHGEHESAMADAEKAIVLNSKSSRGYFARGYVYELREQNEPAIADGKKALDLGEVGSECEPSYVNNFENLSNAYMKLGRYDEALNAIDAGTKVVSPKFKWLMCRQRAMILCYKQEFAKAIASLDEALKDKYCGPSAWSLKAYALFGLGKMQEAEETCVGAAKLETEPEGAYHRRAEFWRAVGKPDQAIQDLDKAILLQQSKDYYSLRLRGLCYLVQGSFHNALEDLEEAAILNPYSSKTYSFLALAEDKLGEHEKARKDIDKAFSFPTLFPIMYVNRASIELDEGRLQQALSDASTAITKDPYLKEAYEVRSAINKKLGRINESEGDLEMSKKLKTHFEWIP